MGLTGRGRVHSHYNERRPARRQRAVLSKVCRSKRRWLFHTTFPPGFDELIIIHRLAFGFFIDLGLG